MVIANNVGDVFCYTILTQPDEGSEERPQILAWSVIRKRYPHSDPPTVLLSLENKIVFYLSDGITPIPDPEDEFLQDTLDHRNDCLPPQDHKEDSNTVASCTSNIGDVYRDSIIEVLGPPRKWQRTKEPTTIGEISISMPPCHSTPTNMESGIGQGRVVQVMTQPDSNDDAFNLDQNDSASNAHPPQQREGVMMTIICLVNHLCQRQ